MVSEVYGDHIGSIGDRVAVAEPQHRLRETRQIVVPGAVVGLVAEGLFEKDGVETRVGKGVDS